jgi:hypothetical protein
VRSRANWNKKTIVVRLGLIEAAKDSDRISYTEEDLLALPKPLEWQWKIGRTSPAYGRSALEREIVDSQDRAAKRLLASWRYKDEDVGCIAYVPKKVRGGRNIRQDRGYRN